MIAADVTFTIVMVVLGFLTANVRRIPTGVTWFVLASAVRRTVGALEQLACTVSAHSPALHLTLEADALPGWSRACSRRFDGSAVR